MATTNNWLNFTNAVSDKMAYLNPSNLQGYSPYNDADVFNTAKNKAEQMLGSGTGMDGQVRTASADGYTFTFQNIGGVWKMKSYQVNGNSASDATQSARSEMDDRIQASVDSINKGKTAYAQHYSKDV